jgi:hypothetical protein
VIAQEGTTVLLDQHPVDATTCEVARADGLPLDQASTTVPWLVYRCQLSFPSIDATRAAPDNVGPGDQNDGVHVIQSDRNVGAIVSGFDSFVSYGYAAGTQLETINVQ